MQPKELSGLSRSNSAPPEVAGAPCKASPTSRSSSPIWTPPPNGDSTISTPSACSSPPARGYPQHSHQLNSYQAPAYPRVLDELVPAACHLTEQYGNNRLEADHGRLKARLRPMRGLKQLRSTRVICAGHAFVQNVRRGHYELGSDTDPKNRLTTAFTELAFAI